MEEEEVIYMPLSPFNEEVVHFNTVTYFVNTFSEFCELLREYEIQTNSKFVLSHSLKKFTAENVAIRENSKLRWKDDIPYYHVCTRTYTCHQGKDGNIYQKKKYAEHRDAKALTDYNSTKRYNKVYTTKKLDCPAVISVSRIVWIPEHKLQGNLTKSFEKKKMSRMIKNKICKGEPVGEECFMFNLPDETDHKYHSVGTDSELTASYDTNEVDQEYHLDETDPELTEPLDSEMSDGNVMYDYIHNFDQEDEPKALIPSYISDNYVPTIEQCETPEPRGNRNKLLISCKSSIKSIQSTMPYLGDDKLKTLLKTLDELYMNITKEVKTEKSTEPFSNEPHIPASSGNDYELLHLGPEQDDESVVVSDGIVKSSEDIEINEENLIETNSLKRKQKATMVVIKKGKYDRQLSIFRALPNDVFLNPNQTIYHN